MLWGLEYFRDKYQVEVYASEDAKPIYKDPSYTLASTWEDVNVIIDKFLKDGEKIEDFAILCKNSWALTRFYDVCLGR